MKREPISDDYAARLIAAAKEGEIYTYGASGGEESQFTVMGGLNTIPRDQYVPKQVLFDLLYTLTEPVEYINSKDPAGYVFGSGPIGFNEDACYSHYLREFVRDNDDYVSIAHTQSAQLLTEPEFANIIRYQLLTAMKEEGIDADGNPASTYYNGLMGHKREDGTMELGLWDAVSLGFAENAHGHVVTLTPRADNERIFVRTELPCSKMNRSKPSTACQNKISSMRLINIAPMACQRKTRTPSSTVQRLWARHTNLCAAIPKASPKRSPRICTMISKK